MDDIRRMCVTQLHTWPFNTSATERHTWQPVARIPSWRGKTSAGCERKYLQVTMDWNSPWMRKNKTLRPFIFHMCIIQPFQSTANWWCRNNMCSGVPHGPEKLKQILPRLVTCAPIQGAVACLGVLQALQPFSLFWFIANNWPWATCPSYNTMLLEAALGSIGTQTRNCICLYHIHVYIFV